MRDTINRIKDKRQLHFEKEKTKSKLTTRGRTHTNSYYADARSQSFSMAERHPFAARVFVMVFNARCKFRRFCMIASWAHGQYESSSSFDILNLLRVASKWNENYFSSFHDTLIRSCSEHVYLWWKDTPRCRELPWPPVARDLHDRRQCRLAWGCTRWCSIGFLEFSRRQYVGCLRWRYLEATSR